MSTPTPCPLLRTNSGARYPGVPHKVLLFVSFAMTFAKPMSMSFK